MIFRVNYEGGLFVDIELYDTEAVRKFRWAHISNLKPNQYSRTFKPDHWVLVFEGYTDRSTYPIKEKEQIRKDAVERINTAIDQVNHYTDGKPFPYKATYKMGFIKTQKIHRAFTTAMSTGHCWDHNLSKDQLYDLFNLKNKGAHLRDKVQELTEPTFTIIDNDNFNYWMEEINQGVHDFEPTIESPRNNKSRRDGVAAKSVGHNPILPDNNIYFAVTELTDDDLKESMQYIEDADVFLNSQIYGKTYIETYNENDPPYEFDVKNVEHVNGSFFTVPYDKDKFTKYLTDSDWTRWLEEHNIPQYLSHPVPLGKIVKSNLPWKIERFYNHKIKCISTQFISDIEKEGPDLYKPLASDVFYTPRFKVRHNKI